MEHKEIRVRDCGLDSTASGQNPLAGSCEHGDRFSSFIDGGKFLVHLNGRMTAPED
jgi:hypothetical protein